jgi:O-methyltransferase
VSSPSDLYLDLLKKVLTRYGFDNDLQSWEPRKGWVRKAAAIVDRVLDRKDLALMHRTEFDAALREVGRDWPQQAETMVGLKRLDNVQFCVEAVLRDGIPGDLLEAGVWRGGTAIFMRAVLAAHGVHDRTVWVADSFEGLPPPDPNNPADEGDIHHTFTQLAVGVDAVKANFERYGMLDDNVKFLKGFFSDSLPGAPIGPLAVLRADADMYGSTMDILRVLYDKVSPGGFVIIDDYSNKNIPGCKAAVDEFRAERGIVEPIHEVDWTGVYWRRNA